MRQLSVFADGAEQPASTRAAAISSSSSSSTDAAPVNGIPLSIPFQLRSADDLQTPFTNYVRGYCGLLDYMWYEPSRLKVERAIPLPTLEEVKGYVPSERFPSDHLSVRGPLATSTSGHLLQWLAEHLHNTALCCKHFFPFIHMLQTQLTNVLVSTCGVVMLQLITAEWGGAHAAPRDCKYTMVLRSHPAIVCCRLCLSSPGSRRLQHSSLHQQTIHRQTQLNKTALRHLHKQLT